jgi:hypothetical protein
MSAGTLVVGTINSGASAPLVLQSNNTTALTLDTSQNATFAGTAAMASSFKRNRIINGNMLIWQRATTATGNYSVTYTYASVDRWAIYSANTSTTFAQSTSVPAGFQYSTKMQRPSGSTATGTLLMGQAVESVNCYDLSSQSVTLSFWAKAGANFSATGSIISVNATTGTVADQGIGIVNSWTGVAAPISTTTLAITTTWTKYTLTGTFGAGVLEVACQFSYNPTGTAGADDAVYITGVQLEVGTKATPYEMQIYSDQLAQCQRYYQKYTNRALGVSFTATSLYAGGVLSVPVTMRSAPTLDSGATYIVTSGSAGTVALNPSSSPPSGITTVDQASFYNSSANWSSGIYVAVNCGLSAEL